MDWRKMIDGGTATLFLLITFIGAIITIGIYQFVGLFIGGSLESAAINSGFYYVNPDNLSEGLTTVGTGFNTTTTNMITNVGLVNTPISFFGTLLLVIMVLAVFGGIIYFGYRSYKGSKDGGSDMGL